MEKMHTRKDLVQIGDTGACLQFDANGPLKIKPDNAEERKGKT